MLAQLIWAEEGSPDSQPSAPLPHRASPSRRGGSAALPTMENPSQKGHEQVHSLLEQFKRDAAQLKRRPIP